MAVPQDYIFRIGIPYTKKVSDNTEIAIDNAANKKWKDAYKRFKPRIRGYLKGIQGGRCAFCRCFINESGGYANLEHLVSKDHISPVSMFITKFC